MVKLNNTEFRRVDRNENVIEMSVIDGWLSITASGPDVHESVDVFVMWRSAWTEENEPPASTDGYEKIFAIIAEAFMTHMEVHDTPWDYEDSRDAGKTWVLWERVAQALGFANLPKPFEVY